MADRQAVYYDKLDVLNRGVDGYNTSWYVLPYHITLHIGSKGAGLTLIPFRGFCH